jgi:hypothetical protein
MKNKQGVSLAVSSVLFSVLLLFFLQHLLLSVQRPEIPAARISELKVWSQSSLPGQALSPDSWQLSRSGRRGLAVSSSGEELLLWEDGLGTTRLNPQNVRVAGRPQFSADGSAAVFLGRQEEGKDLSVYRWREGRAVETILPQQLHGSWTLSASDSLATLLLAPEDGAAIGTELSSKLADHVQPFVLSFLPVSERQQTEYDIRTLDRSLPGGGTFQFSGEDPIRLAADGKSVRLTRLAGRRKINNQDVDGDGAADLLLFSELGDGPLWQAATTGGLDGPSSSTVSKFTRILTSAFGQPAALPVAGDYDGDGLADFATYTSNFDPSRGAEENWYIALSAAGALHSGNTAAGPRRVLRFYWGNAGDRAVPADYDGDGKTDVAVYDPLHGIWSILYSGGGFSLAQASRGSEQYGLRVQFGLPGDIPVPGDYDGDGRSDPAVVRGATQPAGTPLEWFVRFSGGKQQSFSFGASGDIPLVGDFDGDGKSDAAVWRLKNGKGIWHLHLSGDKEEQIFWCDKGGEPFSGDFDGDGRDDLGCFRHGEETPWNILLMRFNQRGRELFGSNAPVVFRSTWSGNGAWPAALSLRRHQAGAADFFSPS